MVLKFKFFSLVLFILNSQKLCMIYRVRLDNFNMTMSFFGIDADSRCDYRSNVDFVHFMWHNFERFSVRKIAITILPSDNRKPLFPHPFPIPIFTKLVYLKYYRAFSENCDVCTAIHRETTKHLADCSENESNCSCIMCKLQPPSLRNICSDIYFRNIQNLN